MLSWNTGHLVWCDSHHVNIIRLFMNNAKMHCFVCIDHSELHEKYASAPFGKSIAVHFYSISLIYTWIDEIEKLWRNKSYVQYRNGRFAMNFGFVLLFVHEFRFSEYQIVVKIDWTKHFCCASTYRLVAFFGWPRWKCKYFKSNIGKTIQFNAMQCNAMHYHWKQCFESNKCSLQ